MNPKKIILCPNPNRDQGMKPTRAAEEILHQCGFQTVVCSPFRDRQEGAFADYDVLPLPQELRGADLLITFGGDGTILLTDSGLEIASRIYRRHKILTRLFERMGVSPEQAAIDACKVEHDLSEETFTRICSYVEEAPPQEHTP